MKNNMPQPGIRKPGFTGLWMRWRTAAVAAFSMVAVTVMLMGYADGVGNDLSDNMVRFHVVANSDTAFDQALKKDVRDAVLNYLGKGLKDSPDADGTKSFIRTHLDGIENAASTVVKAHGKEYPVRAKLGQYPFPTKQYGDIALPAVFYQALRVEIGQADGANWWCVLFPPLCFVDATHSKVSDSMKKDLQDVLTDEEYDIVSGADNDKDIPIKIRFKIVEFFEDSKVKFTGMISSLFK